MSDPRISLVHQINPSNAQQVALALAETGLLQNVITTIAYKSQSPIWHYLNILPKTLNTQITNELGRRSWLSIDESLIQTYPWQEIVRLLLSRTKLAPLFGLSYKQLTDWVYVCLDRHVAKDHLKGLDAIYSYEDGAAITFEVAKQKGLLCLYDLPIPFHQMTRNIMLEEAELFPEIAAGIESVDEPAWKIERKEREIELADHIFVASSITQKSLLEIGIQPEKISLITYGAPIEYFRPQPKIDNCFRALYVGRISPRKGVHYLLQAWQEIKLKNSELLLVGTNLFPQKWLEKYVDIYRHISSIPHLLLNNYYSMGSVVVFPSLIEGFGLVILEAMACGIPVITTPNTGGIDIITDGVDGFIIPIRDKEAIKEKLEWCYEHPTELAEMGCAARCKAEQLTWILYRQKLVNKIEEILCSRN